MKGLDRRLGQVKAVSHRRAQTGALRRYDVSDLTPQEQYELAMLLARSGAASPQEAWAQVPLTPDEEAHLAALAGRVRVTAGSPGDHRRHVDREGDDADHAAETTTGAGDGGAAPPTACSGRSL